MPDVPRDEPVIRTKHNADGWPRCPRCGEDELCTLMDARERSFDPPLSRYWGYPFRCYLCDWRGYIDAPLDIPDRPV